MADAGGAPVLKAVSCCRAEPGSNRSTAPAVLSGSQGGPDGSARVALATVQAPAAAAAAALRAPAAGSSPGIGPPLLSTRSTILRL